MTGQWQESFIVDLVVALDGGHVVGVEGYWVDYTCEVPLGHDGGGDKIRGIGF